jgi:hypothetical protein
MNLELKIQKMYVTLNKPPVFAQELCLSTNSGLLLSDPFHSVIILMIPLFDPKVNAFNDAHE